MFREFSRKSGVLVMTLAHAAAKNLLVRSGIESGREDIASYTQYKTSNRRFGLSRSVIAAMYIAKADLHLHKDRSRLAAKDQSMVDLARNE